MKHCKDVTEAEEDVKILDCPFIIKADEDAKPLINQNAATNAAYQIAEENLQY